jgi:outer membrane autotransporter protein
MKKLFICVILFFFCLQAHATAATGFGVPEYLAEAADAWSSVAGGASVPAPQALVITRMNEVFMENSAAFQDMIAVLAYNESPLTVFTARRHLDGAFSVISRTDASRKDEKRGEKRALIIQGDSRYTSAEFESSQNGGFKSSGAGMGVSVKGYLSPGWAIGVGYAGTAANIDDKRIYANGQSDSITAFVEYLSRDGVFANGGINIGRTNWTSDKIAAGISDSADYDTEFWAAQLTAGIKFGNDSFFAAPQIGGRYMSIKSEKHTDKAVQSFDEWGYDSLDAIANLRLGTKFVSSADVSFVPELTLGGSYGLIGKSDDFIHATLANGSAYDIPVETGARASMIAGVSLTAVASSFAAEAGWNLNYGQNYVAHTGFAKLKLMF